MKKIFFLLIILAVSLFQVTLLDYFKVFGVKPDLLLCCMLIASLYFEFKWAILFSILSGILKDALAGYAFGINTALFLLWSYAIIRLARSISVDNNFMPLAFIIVISMVNDIILRPVFFSFLNLSIPLGIFLRITFLESLYTALAFLLLFRFVRPVLYLKRSCG